MTVRRRIIPLKSGKMSRRWVVDVKHRHPDGRIERVRRASPEQTKQGAEKCEREIRNRLEREQALQLTGPAKALNVPTLSDFWPRFYATHVVVNNKPSEAANKCKIMTLHLLPRYGTRKLDAITVGDIETYKAEMIGLSYKPKTINNHLTVLRTILKTAESWDVLRRAPRIKLLRVPRQEFRFLDFEETKTLLAASEDSWRPMITLALSTGLRVGELLALRWQDVNLARYSLCVCRTNWQGIIGTPKSGRNREVPLNHGASSQLEALPQINELVFCHATGRPWTYREVNYALSKIAKRAGLRRLQWHALRHTFASHLVMRGVSLTAVQELLGHGSQAMTERYAHLTPDIKRTAVLVLDEL